MIVFLHCPVHPSHYNSFVKGSIKKIEKILFLFIDMWDPLAGGHAVALTYRTLTHPACLPLTVFRRCCCFWRL